ncbi:MAG: response regulator [Actinomycetota bacterium]|nr:response regulator transcription factor [Actinomycetota bacterium]
MTIAQPQAQASHRVVVVDDHTLLRESVVKIVAAEPGFNVVGQAGRADEAITLVAQQQPDIVILDVSMPGGTGLDIAARIRRESPATRLIFLTVHEDDATVAHAIALGADGYLLKTSSMSELLQAVRAVAQGGSFLSPGIARSVLRRAGGQNAPATLTNRELEILRLIAGGARPAEAARMLFVSPKTVRNHLASIYVKLGVETAAQAIGEAFRRGLVAGAL